MNPPIAPAPTTQIFMPSPFCAGSCRTASIARPWRRVRAHPRRLWKTRCAALEPPRRAAQRKGMMPADIATPDLLGYAAAGLVLITFWRSR